MNDFEYEICNNDHGDGVKSLRLILKSEGQYINLDMNYCLTNNSHKNYLKHHVMDKINKIKYIYFCDDMLNLIFETAYSLKIYENNKVEMEHQNKNKSKVYKILCKQIHSIYFCIKFCHSLNQPKLKNVLELFLQKCLVNIPNDAEYII